ncbi:hypothetical protein [Streptomyces sp. H27-C3]|uniref:hypothetical protein n=1 Tax=Streptomyces sp. H27-C3 TaxID=3046305 RepID=UPI0024B884DD|nr:hypothetical protein [Streptomyces sp. H27-C3]MDJ0463937.1 hypothetical protein [Streptomyces sp. H27-C3]
MVEAGAAYIAAAASMPRAGDTRSEAEPTMRRGYLRWDEGRVEEPTCRLAGLPDEALRLHRQALDLAPKLGYRYAEALAHEGSAAVLDETDPREAAEHRAAGHAILQELAPGA